MNPLQKAESDAPSPSPPTVTVEIESLAYEGWGVGRSDGRVIFVQDTCPGDRVDVRLERDLGSHGFARVVRMLRNGPARRSAACPVAGECGGCQWQQIDERVQREQKLAVFRDLLRRIGGIAPSDADGAPVLGILSPRGPALGYRTRVRIAVQPRGPAFRRGGSREEVPVSGCPVAVEPLHRLLAAWAERPPAWFATGDFHEAEVTWCASPGGFQVNLITRPGRRPRQPKNDKDREGRGLFYAVDGRWPGGGPPRALNPPGAWTYLIPPEALGRTEGLYMTAGPGEFLQPNPAENAALIETVLDFSRPAAGPGAAGGRAGAAGERALDLYCGVGNLSLPLALAGYGVLGVDSSSEGIRRARENAKRNGVDGCEFKALSVERALARIRRGGDAFDLVVLDPPRAGCKKIVDAVADIRPGRILYVSCNPATLARDLKSLAQRGYRLAESRLVDFFPQTYHIESVNLLLSAEVSGESGGMR